MKVEFEIRHTIDLLQPPDDAIKKVFENAASQIRLEILRLGIPFDQFTTTDVVYYALVGSLPAGAIFRSKVDGIWTDCRVIEVGDSHTHCVRVDDDVPIVLRNDEHASPSDWDHRDLGDATKATERIKDIQRTDNDVDYISFIYRPYGWQECWVHGPKKKAWAGGMSMVDAVECAYSQFKTKPLNGDFSNFWLDTETFRADERKRLAERANSLPGCPTYDQALKHVFGDEYAPKHRTGAGCEPSETLPISELLILAISDDATKEGGAV